MRISKNLQQKLSDFVGRAPSPHNTQPWELHWSPEGVFVREDKSRRLPACDPQQRDHFGALGAFIEGIHLILSEEGLGVRDFGKINTDPLVFELDITPGFSPNPLASMIPQRQSYRGVFKTAETSDIQALKDVLNNHEALLVTDKSVLKLLAAAADLAATESNKNENIQSELYHWLRFKKSHPQYSLDGMNREALALPASIAAIADILMKPSMYRKVDSIHLSGILNSEKAQIVSSTGLVCLQSDSNETPLNRGRKLYRLWLDLTAAGFYACPQSTLTDDEKASQKLAEILKSDKTSLCLRVGRLPNTSLPLPARRDLVFFRGVNDEN